MKIGKYIILSAIMILIFIVVGACANGIERVASQEIAYGAVQQFNENVNSYAEISINTGIKNVFILLTYLLGLIGEIICVKTFIRWIKKDI